MKKNKYLSERVLNTLEVMSTPLNLKTLESEYKSTTLGHIAKNIIDKYTIPLIWLVSVATSFAGIYVATKIIKWMNIRKRLGFKKCNGDSKCELKIIESVLKEANTKGLEACRKSQNPDKCFYLLDKSIRDYERLRRKIKRKLLKNKKNK